MIDPTGLCCCVATGVALIAGGARAAAQDPARSDTVPPISYGLEVAFSSGHADRGFIISDRPVVQPVTWVSANGAEFSVWSNFTLAQTTDRLRPQIVELELTREHRWKNFKIGPAVRMFFYHDPPSRYSTRSIEGWLYLSYDAGSFRLFSNHSLDVLTYRGAYFGEAGIAAEPRVSPRFQVGGSLAAGWASATFNAAYADVAKAALDRVSVEGWLTAYITPRVYIGPHVEFSSIVNREVRTQLLRPTYVLVRLMTGGEF